MRTSCCVKAVLRKFLSALLLFALCSSFWAADSTLAASKRYSVRANAKVYARASTSSKVVASRGRGSTVTVTGVKGKWARVKKNGKSGYMLKSALVKPSAAKNRASSSVRKTASFKKVNKKAYAKTAAKIYKKPSASSKVLASRRKGASVTVTGVGNKWLRVKKGSTTGYMKKSLITFKAPKSRRISTSAVQRKLCRLGYLKTKYVNGRGSGAYKKALRQFQMMNGLQVSGRATAYTKRKILSTSRKKPSVKNVPWRSSGMSARFPRGKVASIVEIKSGIRMKIRRVGGKNHIDAEPATIRDTAKLKKMYRGKFSWSTKPVLLVVGRSYYAASINSYPHGKEISKTNGYNGQFCLHLKNSKHHLNGKPDIRHQRSIRAAANYFG
ncbi:MAG: SH3 domain-containing protein [Christensenellales bacterium]|jgi:SH3-like domain-containing protein